MLDIKKSTHYCYLRYYKAISREASLWWLNRHYELSNKERMEEVYGRDRVIQYKDRKRYRG